MKKKILSLCLIIISLFSFSFFGCGSNQSEEANNGVYLNLNNYSQYLTVDAKCYGTDIQKSYDENGAYYAYQNIVYSVDISPASESLVFTDAMIIVKINCEYQYIRASTLAQKHSETLSVKLNIGGSGSKLLNKPTATDDDVLLQFSGAYKVEGLSYEVMEISGQVTLN